MDPAIAFSLASLALGFVAALTAGVFQAFSDFVMRGLLSARPASGVEAMQGVNRTVFGSVFLAAFLALTPLTIAVALFGWVVAGIGAGGAFAIAGAALYGASVFLVTVAGNVPMNQQLDRLDPDSEEAARYWALYGRRWTRLNHVRTFGAAATAALFLAAGATGL